MIAANTLSAGLRAPRATAARASCALALALGAAASPARAQQASPPIAQIAHCTPSTVALDGAAPTQQKNPIAFALRSAGPGTLIELEPGDYPHFGIGFNNPWEPWNAKIEGGARGNPITIRGSIGTRIVPAGSPDTIAICQQFKNAYVRFEKLTIVPGERAGVIFFHCDAGQEHRGFSFVDCDILGEWDAASQKGPVSKWGVWGHQMAEFEFLGTQAPARIQDIRNEHAFYLQNPRGDLLIENVEARRLGRTFLQLVAREREGPPGQGKLVLRRCKVWDAGISPEDAYKGGTAITLAGGGPQFAVLIERCEVRAGFESALLKLKQGFDAYGTGAIVAWDGGEKLGNGSVEVRDCLFEFAPKCGDRPLASFAACQDLLLENNRFLAGGADIALSIDPREFGKPKSLPNQKVRIGANEIRGAVELGSERGGAELLKAYRVSESSPASKGAVR